MDFPTLLSPEELRTIQGAVAWPDVDADAARWRKMRRAIAGGDDAFMQSLEAFPFADPELPTEAELDAAVDDA